MVTGASLDAEQVRRQVDYWIDLAEYDMETARAMLASRRLLYVAFMCHQVVEKALKGAFVARCQTMAPRVHALVAVAQQSGLYDGMTPAQHELLDALDPMNIECRYPANKEKLLAALTVADCERMIAETEEFFTWIKHALLNE